MLILHCLIYDFNHCSLSISSSTTPSHRSCYPKSRPNAPQARVYPFPASKRNKQCPSLYTSRNDASPDIQETKEKK